MSRTCKYCAEPIPEGRSALAKFCSAYCRGMSFYVAHRGPLAPLPTPAERFAAFVGKPDGNGCTPWTGALFGPTGYGAFTLGRATIGAHRAAWVIANGPIPEGMIVRHRCDNRPCVNLDHLELGTVADNARDAAERKRKPLGTYHPRARLADDDVEEIRRMYATGDYRQRDLAARFGCTQAHVSQLVRRTQRREASRPAVTTPARVA